MLAVIVVHAIGINIIRSIFLKTERANQHACVIFPKR